MSDLTYGPEWPLTLYVQPASGRVSLAPHPCEAHLWRPIQVAPIAVNETLRVAVATPEGSDLQVVQVVRISELAQVIMEQERLRSALRAAAREMHEARDHLTPGMKAGTGEAVAILEASARKVLAASEREGDHA